MRIVHYSTLLTRSAGGLFYSVSSLARAQAKFGAEVTVVGGADRYFEQDHAQWNGVELRPHALFAGTYGFSLQAMADIAALKPDILHIQGIWTAGSIYGRLAVLRGIPVVVSPRGMLDPWILARRPRVKAVHSALFERPMLSQAFVHALSQSELDSTQLYAPGTRDRSFIVPNGTEAIPSAPGVNRVGTLYLGRLHPKKQVIELARAWGASERLKGMTLTIAGWGEPEYEAQLRATLVNVPNVTFVGSLYGEAKSSALSRAEFFILPSLSEGLPMAVLEALQYGCIPIITDQCNLPELLADDIALRIDPSFSDFESVMTRVSAMEADERHKRSQNSRIYSQRYLWDEIAKRMMARYDHILAMRRA